MRGNLSSYGPASLNEPLSEVLETLQKEMRPVLARLRKAKVVRCGEMSWVDAVQGHHHLGRMVRLVQHLPSKEGQMRGRLDLIRGKDTVRFTAYNDSVKCLTTGYGRRGGRCRAIVLGAGDGNEWVLGASRVILHEKVCTRSAYHFVVNNFLAELACLHKNISVKKEKKRLSQM